MARTYVVKSGDTLSGIGAKTGVDWRKITGFRSGNVNLIFPGEVLTLPGGGGGSKKAAAKPKTKAQVQPFLTKGQIAKAKKGALPKVRTEEQIRAGLEKQGLESVDLGERPEVPSLRQEFEDLREEQGVEILESRLLELRGAEDEVIATLRQRSAAQRGKGVALNVVEGRIGEIERQERENLDFIQRQKSRVIEELEQKYSVISIMMDLFQKDYANSLADYNLKFKQNLDMINLVRDIRQDEKDEVEQAKDNARANLQIVSDLVTAGRLDLRSYSAAQRLELAKIEIAAGFSPGFLSKIDGRIITTSTLSNGQVQVVIKHPNGTITTKRMGTPLPPKPTSSGGGGTSKQKNTSQTIKDLQAATITLNGYQGSKGWIGTFPQIVAQYANSLTLDQIYSAYSNSAFGKKHGKPKENRGKMEAIYNEYR